MTESNNIPALLGEAFMEALRLVVREEIQAAIGQNGYAPELLTPKELAARLKLPARPNKKGIKQDKPPPVSWVYEQSRQGKIPTHRIGRYIRFDLQEVLASLKKD
jgi:hypothetical protein